jgi:hypothetical protein
MTVVDERLSVLMSMLWSQRGSNPLGPSKSTLGLVIPRPASIVVYTARMPVLAGETPFQLETC